MLQDEHILQWACMTATVAMVAQFLHLETASSSTTSIASSSSTSSRSGAATSNAHSSRQPAAGSMSGRQWPPLPQAACYRSSQHAALAPTGMMPAAYSSVLEQLGCSKEVALWIATQLTSGWEAQHGSGELSAVAWQTWLESIGAGALQLYDALMRTLANISVFRPKPAALQTSAAAASCSGCLACLLAGCRGCEVAANLCAKWPIVPAALGRTSS